MHQAYEPTQYISDEFDVFINPAQDSVYGLRHALNTQIDPNSKFHRMLIACWGGMGYKRSVMHDFTFLREDAITGHPEI
jgi:hypothetical protein